MSEQSEFGKGFVLCLVKFAEHFMYDLYDRESPQNKIDSLKIWGSEERLISSRIALWANGASDHLYEIEAPAGEEWDGVRENIATLKKMGLAIGHGYNDRIYTIQDRIKLMEVTEKIALETDNILGVKSEIGKW